MWHRTIRNVSRRYYSEATAASKEKYYSELGAKVIDEKPDGWDEAKPYTSIPGPTPIPLLGNTWRFLIGDMSKDFHVRDRLIHNKYGDIVALKRLGTITDMVICFNTADIEKMFRNEGAWPLRDGFELIDHYRYGVRNDVFGGTSNLVNSQGKEWFDLRSFLNPIVMPPNVANQYVTPMDDVASDFIERMTQLSKANPNSEMPKDFDDELAKWAFESISLIAIDTRLGLLTPCPDPDLKEAVVAMKKSVKLMFFLNFTPMGYYARTYNFPIWKKFIKLQNTFLDTTLKYVDRAEEKILNDANYKNLQENEKSIFQKLLEKDKKIASINALDMLGGGIDTTARVSGAIIYFLAKYPDKQNILREELKKHLPKPNSPITKENLAEMPYLKAVVKETLRIAPAVPINMRKTQKRIVLGGYQIPAGVNVAGPSLYLSLYGNQYVKALEFLPERFLRTTVGELSYKNASPFVNLPFGFGPRSCIGQRLAYLEMEVLIGKIVRNFQLEWPHKDMKFGQDLMYGIQEPLRVRIKKLEE